MLLDIVAPAIQIDERGGTLRQWKYAKAELLSIIQEMKPDFDELTTRINDGSDATDLFEATKGKFYERLQKLDGPLKKKV